MKRLMLVTTTALTLSAPAFAQSGPEEVVTETLMGMGYDQAAISTLTDAEVTELYIAITSDDMPTVRNVIAGFDLGNAEAPGASSAERLVSDTLLRMGYDQAMVDMLSDAQVNELYITLTSDDGGDVRTVIDGFDLSNATSGGSSDAEDAVFEELMARGLEKSEISNVSDAEIAEIYIALNSGNASAIDAAISSAIES